MRRQSQRRFPALFALLLLGCAQSPDARPAAAGESNRGAAWDGEVQRWGTLREVLRLGETEARVDLTVAADRAHAYGIGALEGVEGEVLVHDGVVWISRVEGDACRTRRLTQPATERATLLALAHVPRWTSVPVERAVPADEVDAFVAAEARRLGLDLDRPFPLVVEGPLSGLALHVLNGACPFAQPLAPDDPRAPLRRKQERARGLLVGFYSQGAPGELTHHGSATHLHVLLHGDEPLMGHVDAVGLQPGAVLRLPRVSESR